MAVLMTTYLRKQIAEITLPSAPRPGVNIKQTFRGVLSDFDSRERWMSRFSYWSLLFSSFLNDYPNVSQSSAVANVLHGRSCRSPDFLDVAYSPDDDLQSRSGWLCYSSG
jgi:hypothetical protein